MVDLKDTSIFVEDGFFVEAASRIWLLIYIVLKRDIVLWFVNSQQKIKNIAMNKPQLNTNIIMLYKYRARFVKLPSEAAKKIFFGH